MKDSFLGVASHELKTPLTVILGYAELILSERAAVVEPSVLEMIEHIAGAAGRLSEIVRDMLDVSLLDAQQVDLQKREMLLNDLIRDLAREVEIHIHKREQALELKLEPDLPKVLCDPERMTQVLTHLVSNAIKFTPNAGTVTIESRAVKLLRPPTVDSSGNGVMREIDPIPNPYVEVIVRDTGIGIAEKDQLHVFDKFFEAGSIEEHFTEKVAFKGKGTGLGLTIVKGIVELHNGEIWVESPGQAAGRYPGSAFHVVLPIPGE
jgi:signal transduction histidine kinase